MDDVREGDLLLVTKLDRLARWTSDLYRIVTGLEAKGVAFKVLDDSAVDTTTRAGKLVMGILARRRLLYAPKVVAYCRSLPVNPGRSITSRLTMPNGTLPR